MSMAEIKETYTKEEMQKILAAQRQQDIMMAYGKQWFMESLSHTENLVRQGAFPQEAHQVGQICFQQFMGNTAPKEEEKKPEDE